LPQQELQTLDLVVVAVVVLLHHLSRDMVALAS
jgi:hypothetical protein